jgi:hypothetical protein
MPRMPLKDYQEEIVMKEYYRIIKEISGASVLGIPVDLYDNRIVVIAAYYLGQQEGEKKLCSPSE